MATLLFSRRNPTGNPQYVPQNHIEATIWAVPEAEAQANADKADVILLGPQVRFLLDKIKAVAEIGRASCRERVCLYV